MKIIIRDILLILVLTSFVFCKDKPININFNNLNLEEFVKIVSKHTNKNILLTSKVEGTIDFISNRALSSKELFELLKVSLHNNGYELEKSNSIYVVVKKELEKSPKKIKNKSLYVSQIMYLKFIEAKNLKEILTNIISKRDYSKDEIPSISYNENSNFIVIDGKKTIVDGLKKFINNIDKTKTQVYIKAKIVEVDDNLVEQIGIKYGILGGNVYGGGINSFSSSLNSGDALPFDISSIGLSLPNLSSSLALGATINLLNKTYALDIVSQPSILCLNNQESSIYVGETVSVQTASSTTDGGTTKNSFERQDIGLTLKVKPRVVDDNKVLIDINTILEGIKNIDLYSSNPNTNKKQIKTTAIVNNGESVILGGLIENKNEKTLEKVPVVSDIPLIGDLFKNKFNNKETKNLTVIITPYIVPKNKDISFVREELSKIQVLEDKLLDKILKKYDKKEIDKSKISVKNQKDIHLLHRQMLKEF